MKEFLRIFGANPFGNLREEERKWLFVATILVAYNISREEWQERHNDAIFIEEGSVFEESIPNNFNLENYNNLNHPHIDIKERWRSWKRSKLRSRSKVFICFMKKIKTMIMRKSNSIGGEFGILDNQKKGET
jgi:hypothetical protein